MEDIKQMILQQAEADDRDALRQAEVQLQKSQNIQNRYAYGVSLIQTNDPGNQEKGVGILQELSENQSKEISRDALYWASFGLFRLKNYPEALTWNGRLLSKNPSNQQAQALNELILESKEGGTRRPLKRNKSLRSIKKATSVVANSAKQAVNLVKTKAGLDKEPKKDVVVKGDGGKVKFGGSGGGSGNATPSTVTTSQSQKVRELPKLPARPESKDSGTEQGGSLSARERKGGPTYEMTIHSAREPSSKAVSSSPGSHPNPGLHSSAKSNDVADIGRGSDRADGGAVLTHGKSVGELLKGGFNPLAGRPGGGGMARTPGGGGASGGVSGGAVASGSEFNFGQRPVMIMPGMATGPPKMKSASDELPKENLVTDENTGITFSAAPRLQNVKKAGPPKGRRPPGNVKTRAEDTIDPSASFPSVTANVSPSGTADLSMSAPVTANVASSVTAGFSTGFSPSASVGKRPVAGPSRRPPQHRSPTMPATRVRKDSTPEKPRQEIEAEAEIEVDTPEIVEKTSEKILNRPMGRSIGTPIKVPLSKSTDTTSTPTGSPSWMTAKSNTPQESSPPITSNLTKQIHVEKPVITRSKTDSREGRTPIRAGVDVGGYGGWDRNDDVDVPRKDESDTDPDEGNADDDGRTDEVSAEDEPSPPGAGFEEYPEDDEEELIPCMLCKREFPESSMKILLQKKFCQPCVTRILKAQQDRKVKQQQQQQQPQNQHSPQPQQQRHPSPAFLPQQQQPQQTPQRKKLQHSGGHSHSAQASPMIRNPRPIGTFGMDGGGDFQQGHAMYSAGNDDDYNLQVDFGISKPIPPTSTPATSHLSPEEEADALMGEFRRGYYK